MFNNSSAFMERFHLISKGELLHTFDSYVELMQEYLILRFYLKSVGVPEPIDLDWVVS